MGGTTLDQLSPSRELELPRMLLLRSPHGVGHGGAPCSERLFSSNCRIPGRLMFYFRIELRAEQDNDR
jgi:hypothetical protein